MVGGIATIAGAVSGDIGGILPRQHKAQKPRRTAEKALTAVIQEA